MANVVSTPRGGGLALAIYQKDCTAAGAYANFAKAATGDLTAPGGRKLAIRSITIAAVSLADTQVFVGDYDGSSTTDLLDITLQVAECPLTLDFSPGMLVLPAGHSLQAKSVTGNAKLVAVAEDK